MTSNNVSNNNRRGRGFGFRNRNEAAGCILCGYKNHKAENCRNMKDDNSNIKGDIFGMRKITINGIIVTFYVE